MFRLPLVILYIVLCQVSLAQQTDPPAISINTARAYVDEVTAKGEKYISRVTGKTEKTLKRLSVWETRVRDILLKVDPSLEQQLFSPGQVTFSKLYTEYNQGVAVTGQIRAGYDGYKDQLITSVNYLNAVKDSSSRIRDQVAAFREQDSKTEYLVQQIKQRRVQLLSALMKKPVTGRYLKRINKEGYYYLATINNYKKLLQDEGRLERLVLGTLTKLPAFKSFFEQNSELSALFPAGGGSFANSAPVQNITGLQTRADVNAAIRSSFGPNATVQVQDRVQEGVGRLNQLKEELLQKVGGGSSSEEMPDFRPNSQRSKMFRQRLEYGFNVHSQRARYQFPAMSDLGASIGYMLNDRSVVGLGVAYKLGLGQGWDKIKITNEGFGLRSFIDWKIPSWSKANKGKELFWITGGYEQSYFRALENFQDLRNYNSWQASGLIGVSKKVSTNTKFFKGMKVQVLWDFLSYSGKKKAQPFLYRIVYNFQ